MTIVSFSFLFSIDRSMEGEGEKFCLSHEITIRLRKTRFSSLANPLDELGLRTA